MDQRTERRATRLTEQQGRLWIDVNKHLFDRRVARRVAQNKKMPPQWVGLKFFNVYGPNEYHKGEMRSLVHKSFEQINSNSKVKLFKSHRGGFKDGEQLRDFILYIVQNLVTQKDQVDVGYDEDTVSGTITIHIKVAADDKGRVIGKNGNTIKTYRAHD
jgi:predicted RNA-binding protein YlqC (UPF0109 family)